MPHFAEVSVPNSLYKPYYDPCTCILVSILFSRIPESDTRLITPMLKDFVQAALLRREGLVVFRFRGLGAECLQAGGSFFCVGMSRARGL